MGTKREREKLSSTSSGGIPAPPPRLCRHFLLDELLVPLDVELALAAVVVHEADLAEDGALGPAVVVEIEAEREKERVIFF